MRETLLGGLGGLVLFGLGWVVWRFVRRELRDRDEEE